MLGFVCVCVCVWKLKDLRKAGRGGGAEMPKTLQEYRFSAHSIMVN